MLKVMSQLLRKTRERGLVLPCVAFDSTDDKFAGATVIEPKKGFYTEPVATLDFASLYPSIMMAHNLCYSTLVPAHEVCKMQEQDITRTPTGDCFVKASVKKGILPEILEELLQVYKPDICTKPDMCIDKKARLFLTSVNRPGRGPRQTSARPRTPCTRRFWTEGSLPSRSPPTPSTASRGRR